MMKKVVLWGFAALALASCSKSVDFSAPADYTKNGKDAVVENYANAFVQTFGVPAADQNWGFGSTTTRALTRANALVSGDPFTVYANTDAYYKTSDDIPAEALTYAEYLDLDKWARADWGGAKDQNAAMQGDAVILIPAGTHQIKFTAGKHDFYVTGNATLDVNDYINAARIYVLPNVTFELKGNYINDLEIYVAANATLNLKFEKIYNQTGGGIIFSRGIVNLPSNFEINQNAIFYNEGTISGTNITSKPGDGNPSFLYNFGDVSLSGKFQLNSCANFYNEGTFTVTGETEITQGNSQIWWMNKGHYTTASFKTAAWNSTMYNFCSMFVTGDAFMFNGQFYQMNGSYMEANRGVFQNFQFVMANGSGVNIKNGSLWGRDGADFRGKYDSEYQGFVAVNNAKAWVRLGGVNKILDHKGSAFHVEGADLTFGYADVKFYSTNYNEQGWQYQSFDVLNNSFANESTAESLAAVQSENTTWNLHNVTKVYTGSDFAEVTATPKTNDCGATWTPNEGGGEGGGDVTLPSLHVMAEDLSATEASDFDFNDCVIDVFYVDANTVSITLLAAGGTLPLRINENNEWEVHKLFDVDVTCMVNTGTKYHTATSPYSQTTKPYVTNLKITDKTWSSDQDEFAAQVNEQIKLEVYKDNKWYELKAEKGQPACKIATPVNIYMKDADWYPEEYRWPYEKQNIGNLFRQYVSDPTVQWYTTK